MGSSTPSFSLCMVCPRNVQVIVGINSVSYPAVVSWETDKHCVAHLVLIVAQEL